jgi:hypothetical protein
VVSAEELEALDLMCWLGRGGDAALLGYCNQSTISRRSQNALKVFQLRPSPDLPSHLLAGAGTLLRMEREVHQLYRLQGRGRLRLHAPYWASRLLDNQLGELWMVNPARDKEPVAAALALLEQRVIDALIAENSQRPAADDPTFVCFDLYKAPLRLCAVQAEGNPLCHEKNLSNQDIGALAEVQPLQFLSRPSKECVFELFQYLYGDPLMPSAGGANAQANSYRASFFLTTTLTLPEFRDVQVVDCACDFEATESLVVLRELSQEPCVIQLRERIAQSYLAAISDHPGVAIYAGS